MNFYLKSLKTNKTQTKKSDFINIPKILYGHFSNFIFREKINLNEFPVVQGYKLVKPIRIQSGDDQNSVGIYQNKNGERVIIKSLTYKKNTLAANQLLHEGAMLSLLQTYEYSAGTREIKFPKLYEIVEDPGSISLVMEFITGETIAKLATETKLTLLYDCVNAFEKVTIGMSSNLLAKLPKRTKLFMIITFPGYLLSALRQNLKLLGLLLRVTFQFYKHAVISLFKQSRYVLTHKTLHGDNILVAEHSATIIDPQVCVLAEEFSEIAIIPKFYLKDTGIIGIRDFLLKFLHSEDEVKNFFRLSIYYTVQTLALTGREYTDYNDAKKYLEILNNNLFKDLLKSTKA